MPYSLYVLKDFLFFASWGKEHTPVARQSKAGFNLYLKFLIAVIRGEE